VTGKGTVEETSDLAKIIYKHMSIRWLAVWTLSLGAVFMFSGCEPKTNYKVLSFFFDGVPEPGKTAAAGGGEGASNDKKAVQAVSKSSVHGPFASKNCEGCHDRAAGNKLLLPIDKLCFKCHDLNIEGKKWVHGPVASGGCWICHNPHRSAYPFLLDAPGDKICYRCHEESSVLKNEVHKDLTIGCLECHNPHASQQKFLLRE